MKLVSEAAVEELTDQTLLAKVAKEAKERYVRGAAITKLTDQIALAQLAIEGGDCYVCQAAYSKLDSRGSPNSPPRQNQLHGCMPTCSRWSALLASESPMNIGRSSVVASYKCSTHSSTQLWQRNLVMWSEYTSHGRLALRTMWAIIRKAGQAIRLAEKMSRFLSH